MDWPASVAKPNAEHRISTTGGRRDPEACFEEPQLLQRPLNSALQHLRHTGLPQLHFCPNFGTGASVLSFQAELVLVRSACLAGTAGVA